MERRQIRVDNAGQVTTPNRLEYGLPQPTRILPASFPNSSNRTLSIQDDVIYSWSYSALDGFHYYGATLDTRVDSPAWVDFTDIPQTFDFSTNPVWGNPDVTPVLGYTFFHDGHHYMFPTNGVANYPPILRLDGTSWTALANSPEQAPGFRSWTAFDAQTGIFVSTSVVFGVQKTMLYDANSDSWSYGTNQPTEVYDCGVAVYGGKVYTVGGVPISVDDFTPTPVLTDFQIYDIATDSWSTSTPLDSLYENSSTWPDPTITLTVYGYWCQNVFPPSTNGGMGVDGNLYFFGGRVMDNTGSFNNYTFFRVFSFDTTLEAWTLLHGRLGADTFGIATDPANMSVGRLSDGRLVVAALGEFTGYTWSIFNVEVPNNLLARDPHQIAIQGTISVVTRDLSEAVPIQVKTVPQVTVRNFSVPPAIPPPFGGPPPVVAP